MCNIPKIYNYHFINGCVPAMGPNFSIIVVSHVSYLVSVYINWLRTVPTMLSVLQRFFFFFGGGNALSILPIGMAKLLCNCDF